MKKISKSQIQFGYHSYAMALVDVISYVPIEVANNRLIHRRTSLQNSFSCSLNLLKVHYDIDSSSYKIITVNPQNPTPMKKLFPFIALLVLFASCSVGPHWYTYRHTASGKHGYMVAGWPHTQLCAGMNHRNPVKNVTVRRYNWSPKHVKQ